MLKKGLIDHVEINVEILNKGSLKEDPKVNSDSVGIETLLIEIDEKQTDLKEKKRNLMYYLYKKREVF